MSESFQYHPLSSTQYSGRLLLLVAGASAAVILVAILLTARFGATRKIPKAHFLSAYTPLWIDWIRYTHRENRTLQAAHDKLGPIVQLAPKEISINCVEDGLRTVYGSAAFEKHDWYQSLWNHGEPNMVAYQNRPQHTARKRMLSHIYAKSSILKDQVLTAQAECLLFETMHRTLRNYSSTGEVFNMYYVMASACMDIASAYIFGLRNSSNLLANPGEAIWRIDGHQSRLEGNYFVQEHPWLWNWLQSWGLSVWTQGAVQDKRAFEAWAFDMGRRAEAQLVEEEASINQTGERTPRGLEDTPAVYKQLRSSLMTTWTSDEQGKGEKATGCRTVTREQSLVIGGELTDHFLAGFETATAPLVFMMHEVAANQSLQTHLRAAITSVPKSSAYPNSPDATALENIALLHAVVLETLRLYPPVSGAQARVTPARDPSKAPLTLAGHGPIPAGLRVSARCYCLHRNAEVFPSPELFDPYRWLDATTGEIRRTDPQAKQMHAWFWAFSSGGRMCLGSHFAYRQMKTIVAAVVGGFVVELGQVGQPRPRVWDQYVGGPVGRRLDVRVRRADVQGEEGVEGMTTTTA